MSRSTFNDLAAGLLTTVPTAAESPNRGPRTIGKHYKNLHEKLIDQRVTFEGKLQGIDDRFIDRIAKSGAMIIFHEHIDNKLR